MSYLTLPNGIPDFSKAVISFWFRVPNESIQAAAQEESTSVGERPRLLGVIPLLVFGEMFEGYTVEPENAGTATYTVEYYTFDGSTGSYTYHSSLDETHDYSIGATLREGESHEEDPSYIGIVCTLDEDTGEVTTSLQIRLQTSNFGSGSMMHTVSRQTISDHSILYFANNPADGVPAQDTAYDYGRSECRTDNVYPGGTRFETKYDVDESDIFARRNGPDSFMAGHELEIEPDVWHHLLLSFDLSQPTRAEGLTIFDAFPCGPDPVRTENYVRAITSPCKMWLALDDINRTGDDLLDPRWLTVGRVAGLGDNGIAPYNSIYTAAIASNLGRSSKIWGVTGLVIETNQALIGMPSYQCSPGSLPTQGYEFGIPGTPTLVDRIYRIEMAEFQMWTGVTLDTENETNRRAFVDENGKPVDPTKGTVDEVTQELDPRGPGERLLGKKPEILLHGSSKWKTGYNTGTLGVTTETVVDDEGNVTETLVEIPSGQFTPTALIEKYKPEPALEPETA